MLLLCGTVIDALSAFFGTPVDAFQSVAMCYEGTVIDALSMFFGTPGACGGYGNSNKSFLWYSSVLANDIATNSNTPRGAPPLA